MRRRFTLEGLSELEDVLTFIERKSPHGARNVKRKLQAVTELLLRHPHAGQLTRMPHLRCISAVPYPYLIFYQATEDEIIIHGVRHRARDPRTMPGQT